MAKISSKDIFTNPDIYAGVRKSAEQTIVVLDLIDKKLKAQATTLKKTLSGIKFDTKGINDFLKAVNELNKIQAQSIKLNTARAKSQETINKTLTSNAKAQREASRAIDQNNKTLTSAEKLEQATLRTKRMKAQELEREAKAQAKADQATKNANSAYKQLEINTRSLKNQSKELGAQLLRLEADGKKGSKVWADTKIKYDQVTQSAQKFDAKLKQLDKSVGDNFRNVGNYKDAVGKLQGVMANFGVAFGIANVVGFASKAVQDFEVRNSQLQAVTAKSGPELQKLVDIQRDLGRNTSFTAGEVASLQVELAKLGFTAPEIEQSTEGVLKLAKASGTDLANASAIAGATLRGFGLDAYEMQRVVDVMAKSFSTTALDISKFAESMKYVAPVAKSAGVSLEETTAMLGVLANSGVAGSQAGTSLRRILSDLAGSGKPLSKALEELAEKGLSLADAKDEVGRTAQTALLILTENIPMIKDLKAQYMIAEGSVNAMAQTMDDNLTGAFFRLSSAFEGWILDVNESSGASQKLKESIDWLATNLDTIMSVIFTLVEAFVKYKAVIMITAVQNRILASSFATAVTSGGLLPAVMGGAKAAFQSFNKAISANIIGIVVLALYELYNAFNAVSDASELAEDFNGRVADSMAQIQIQGMKERQGLELLVGAIKRTNTGTEERKRLIEQLNKKYKVNLQDTKDDVKFQSLLTGAYKQANAQITKKIQLMELQAKFQLYTSEIVKIEAENLKLTQKSKDAWGQNGFTEFIQGFGDYENTRGVLDEQKNENTKFLKTLTAEQVKLKAQLQKIMAETADESILDGLIGEMDGLGESHEDLNDGLSKTIPKTKEFNYELKRENEYLSKQRELLQEINEILQDRGILEATDKLDSMLEGALTKVKETGQTFTYVLDPETNLPIDPIIEQIELITKLSKDAEAQRTKYAIEGIELKYKAEAEARRKNAEDEYKEVIKDIDAEIKQVKEGIAEGTETTQSLTNLQNEKKKIEADYLVYKEELKAQEVEIEKDKNKEIEIENLKLVDKNAEIDKDELQKKEDYNQAQLDGLDEYNAKKKEKEDKATEEKDKKDAEDLEKEKAKWNEINDIVKASADFFIQQSERKISQLDKEIQQAQSTYDMLQELAKNGNIDAKESLAEQQRIIEEANRKKRQEERRQQIAKLAETAFNTYNQKIQDGKKGTQALTETIRDITLLTQMVGTLLPAYEKGTENTGNANGQGVDGRGGFNAILHPNERVLTKDQNRLIGDLSNEELSRLAFNYRTNKLATATDSQTMSALDFSLLISKVDNLTKVIKDKPETELNVGQITQTTLELVEQTRRGNTTTYNRFKVNR